MKTKLIVGLGNVGSQYQYTRHNLGFLVIENYLKTLNNSSKTTKTMFNNEITTFFENDLKIILAKPLSFMNLSGKPIISIATYFNISLEDIFIFYDDKDLDFGKIKIQNNRSGGSHNGFKNIIEVFKTKKIQRIKVGIGYDQKTPLRNYVLNKFSKEQLDMLNNFVFKKTNLIINAIIKNYSFQKICEFYAQIKNNEIR